MLGELNNNQIENLLHSQELGRIGCHTDDTTYVVPVSYAYDGTYIYGHTKEGMKIDMMRKNPKVCFEVDVMENMSNWRSVIAWGKFKELKEPEDRKMGMQKLIDRIMPIMTGETTVHHSMTDSQGKYIESIQGVVYRREHKMLTLRKRYSARTTNSHHRFYKYNNIIKDIEVKRYNQVWVSDITYIRTVKGFCYLALITDMHSRKIVGYYLKVIALS